MRSFSTIAFVIFLCSLNTFAQDNWTLQNPATKPSARQAFAMASLGGDQVLLFGGNDAGGLDDETWVYDLSDNIWTQKFPTPKPSARFAHAMASLGGDQVLLFGGGDGTNDDETWVYDLSDDTWTQKAPAFGVKPSARNTHAMAYLGGDEVLLFGGVVAGSADDETWVYDLSDDNWTQKSPVGGPSPKYAHAMASPGGDQVLLFGGNDPPSFDETWVYDLSDNTWTQKTPGTKPSKRYYPAMVSIGGDQLLLFGGFDAGGRDDETWVYDLSDNTWTQKFPAEKPSARFAFAMASFGGDQVLLFGGDDAAFDDETWVYVVITPIHTIQGSGILSPLAGQTLTTTGIVTSLASNGFYIQDASPDADPNTSEGIFVFTSSAPTVNVGDNVSVRGTVLEFRPGGDANNLTITEISTPTIVVLSTGNPLPAATILGNGGRTIPSTIIDDDATGDVETTGTFDPATDGIDFYETLEGMLVQINSPLVISFTNSFEEIWVLADNGVNATGRTVRGGSLLSGTDYNPERIQIDDIIPSVTLPLANPLDQLSNVVGVVSYSSGNYEVLVSNAPTVVNPSGLTKETTSVIGASDKLTVATLDLNNIDPGDGAAQFDAFADMIVTNLQSPDIIIVTSIQDNNGPINDPLTDASVTYTTLLNAIITAGGPGYNYRQINPVDDQDGGEPGSNVRQAFLFNPSRVSFTDRAGGTSTTSTAVNDVSGVPTLSFSPGRIDPTNAAFNSSRKPLVGEFVFNGKTVFVIGTHLNSKGGDQPLFGRNQPPVLSSEVQRNQQATIIKNFVQDILAIDANAYVLAGGNYNDFEFSNPLTTLESAPLNTLTESLPANERYGYNFEGNASSLSHILVSNNLFGNLDGYDIVHAASEFSDQITQHDPIVSRFTFVNNTASVGDRVWNDASNDGIQDGAETGINGVTVELLNSVDAVIGTTTTIIDGDYGFGGLTAGTYKVRVVSSTLPAGATQTYDLDGTGTPHIATFTLTTGQTRTDVDFGYNIFDPCATITTLICATPVTASLSGAGIWNVTACGGTTPGQERVYSFIPALTGVYTLQVTAASGGFVDYFYKEASGGCNATGWICIDDISDPQVRQIGTGTLTAGTTYYILLDAEETTAISQTFQINCPIDPCADIPNIPTISCATPVISNHSNGGVWDVTACTFNTPGQERIYRFIPATTGVYSLQVTAASGGFVDYFYKAASGGCNATGWICIDDISSPATTAPIGTLTGGTTYYILLDAEGVTSRSHTFQINCPAPPAVTYTIFPPNSPGGINQLAQPREVGVKFRVTQPGFITGIRFYKGAANTGTHTGHLWSNTGTSLASVIFTGETASGWQQALFSSPVAVIPNVTYMASYFTPTGNHAITTNFFTSAVVNGPLRALASSEDGGNGHFRNSGVPAFPNTPSGIFSNFWVDVVFTANVVVDNTPPTVISVTPPNGATGVPVNTTVTATFSEDMNAATIGTLTFELHNPSNVLMSATVTYNAGTKTATLTPSSPLANSTLYTATVKGGGSGVKDAANNAMVSDFTWSFTTAADVTPPIVISTLPVHGATGVNVNTTVIANFSEAVNPATVTTTTYELKNGSTVIPATVSTSGSQITLTPLSPLAPGTLYTGVITGGSGGVKDLAGNPLAANYSWQFTTAPVVPVTTYTIFSPGSSGINQLAQPREVGVKFRVTQPGFINGIRFYKTTANTGIHTGHLWSNTGTSLASVVFTGETASGWQQALFSSPVAVIPNVTYMASYFTPTGNHAITTNFFTSAVVNGPIRALASSEDGGNGHFRNSGVPAFPNTASGIKSNFWVDVVFATGIAPKLLTQQTSLPAEETQKLSVQVTPNPSESFFKLIAMSDDDKAPIKVRITDISGRVLEHYEKVTAGSLIEIGKTLKGGAYFAEVIQGYQRKVVKIIKMN